MTVDEFREQLYSDYDVEKEFPVELEVDADTYANVCQAVFENKRNETVGHVLQISVGKKNGIMFKGVELILKKKT